MQLRVAMTTIVFSNPTACFDQYLLPLFGYAFEFGTRLVGLLDQIEKRLSAKGIHQAMIEHHAEARADAVDLAVVLGYAVVMPAQEAAPAAGP